MSEVVQGSPRKEDMQLERNFMELEDTSKDGMKVVSYQVNASLSVNSESYGGVNNERDSSGRNGMMDSEKLGLLM